MEELRRAQADRRRKVADAAAALAQREEQLTRQRKAREDAQRAKAENDEAFFTRWVQDAEEALHAAQEELAQERAAATQARAEHDAALQELQAQFAKELD